MPLWYKSYPISSVTECATMAESLADLPPNVLSDILSRLPIKSLLACRSVCKTFLDLTSSNPYFNSLHSSKTALNLIIHFGGTHSPTRCVHFVDSGLDTAFVFGEDFGFKVKFQIPTYPIRYLERYNVHAGLVNSFVLVNSCDGLLFFAERNESERSFVCNPITNEYVTLLELDEERDLCQQTMGMWFGFSPGESRYKVLRIFSTLTGRPGKMGFKKLFWAQVHVVGSSSWRDIEDRPPCESLTWDTCFTLVNGTVYWLCQYSEPSKFIIFFDFQQEKFGEILPPLELETDWPMCQHCMGIGVLEGCLSVTVNAESLDIWILRNTDTRESWTKQFVIGESILQMGLSLVEAPLHPLQIFNNRHVLMMRPDLILVCYDANEKTFQYINFEGFVSVGKSFLLRPSLVPLKDSLRVNNVMVQKIP